MTNDDFTGDFEMQRRVAMGPPPKDTRVRVTDSDMPAGVAAQPGVGDLEEQFRDVTRGFESMHERVAIVENEDPMVETGKHQDYDDIQRDAGEAAASALDDEAGAFDPMSGRQPLGSVASIDDRIADIAGDEFDVEGRR